MCACSVAQSGATLGTQTGACQASLSMEFSQARILGGGGVPFPIPGDLPDPGIIPLSLASPELAGRFYTTWEIPKLGITAPIFRAIVVFKEDNICRELGLALATLQVLHYDNVINLDRGPSITLLGTQLN